MKIGSIEEGIRNIKTTFISCKICTDDYRHQIVPNHKNSGWNVLFKKNNWYKKKIDTCVICKAQRSFD